MHIGFAGRKLNYLKRVNIYIYIYICVVKVIFRRVDQRTKKTKQRIILHLSYIRDNGNNRGIRTLQRRQYKRGTEVTEPQIPVICIRPGPRTKMVAKHRDLARLGRLLRFWGQFLHPHGLRFRVNLGVLIFLKVSEWVRFLRLAHESLWQWLALLFFSFIFFFQKNNYNKSFKMDYVPQPFLLLDHIPTNSTSMLIIVIMFTFQRVSF